MTNKAVVAVEAFKADSLERLARFSIELDNHHSLEFDEFLAAAEEIYDTTIEYEEYDHNLLEVEIFDFTSPQDAKNKCKAILFDIVKRFSPNSTIVDELE